MNRIRAAIELTRTGLEIEDLLFISKAIINGLNDGGMSESEAIDLLELYDSSH